MFGKARMTVGYEQEGVDRDGKGLRKGRAFGFSVPCRATKQFEGRQLDVDSCQFSPIMAQEGTEINNTTHDGRIKIRSERVGGPY